MWCERLQRSIMGREENAGVFRQRERGHLLSEVDDQPPSIVVVTADDLEHVIANRHLEILEARRRRKDRVRTPKVDQRSVGRENARMALSIELGPTQLGSLKRR